MQLLFLMLTSGNPGGLGKHSPWLGNHIWEVAEIKFYSSEGSLLYSDTPEFLFFCVKLSLFYHELILDSWFYTIFSNMVPEKTIIGFGTFKQQIASFELGVPSFCETWRVGKRGHCTIYCQNFSSRYWGIAKCQSVQIRVFSQSKNCT